VIAVLIAISHSYPKVRGDYRVLAKEIERKFLVSRDDWRLVAESHLDIVQAYICVNDDRNLRVRILSGSRAKITIKVGHSSISRDEFEYDIPLADAQDLLELRVGHRIEKTRFHVPHAGFLFEVDVFSGDFSGLVVAEVELASETDTPDLPAWLGEEVTGLPHYSNQSLALNGLPEGWVRGE